MENSVEAYRVSDFCTRYVISRTSLYREISAKRLRIVKRGRTTLVTRAEAERWFDGIFNPEAKGEI